MAESIHIEGHTIVRELGRGGMATVYLALDDALNRQVAVKVMASDLSAGGEDLIERFRREAQISAALSHPNIINVHSFGVIDGRPYLTMDYLPGGSLRSRQREEGMLEPEFALDVGVQVADALQALHSRGIVHRDLKPDNILFHEMGHAVLADFGIAKLFDASTQLTQLGTTMGTYGYVSPEQARGDEVDGRSDIYSLAVVIYEALTGHLPTSADSTAAFLYKLVHEEVDDLPESFETLQPMFDKALARLRDDRYENVAEFRHALESHRRTIVRAPLARRDDPPTHESSVRSAAAGPRRAEPRVDGASPAITSDVPDPGQARDATVVAASGNMPLSSQQQPAQQQPSQELPSQEFGRESSSVAVTPQADAATGPARFAKSAEPQESLRERQDARSTPTRNVDLRYIGVAVVVAVVAIIAGTQLLDGGVPDRTPSVDEGQVGGLVRRDDSSTDDVGGAKTPGESAGSVAGLSDRRSADPARSEPTDDGPDGTDALPAQPRIADVPAKDDGAAPTDPGEAPPVSSPSGGNEKDASSTRVAAEVAELEGLLAAETPDLIAAIGVLRRIRTAGGDTAGVLSEVADRVNAEVVSALTEERYLEAGELIAAMSAEPALQLLSAGTQAQLAEREADLEAAAAELYEAGYVFAPADGNLKSMLQRLFAISPNNEAGLALRLQSSVRLNEVAMEAYEFDLRDLAIEYMQQAIELAPEPQNEWIEVNQRWLVE